MQFGMLFQNIASKNCKNPVKCPKIRFFCHFSLKKTEFCHFWTISSAILGQKFCHFRTELVLPFQYNEFCHFSAISSAILGFQEIEIISAILGQKFCHFRTEVEVLPFSDFRKKIQNKSSVIFVYNQFYLCYQRRVREILVNKVREILVIKVREILVKVREILVKVREMLVKVREMLGIY